MSKDWLAYIEMRLKTDPADVTEDDIKDLIDEIKHLRGLVFTYKQHLTKRNNDKGE